MPSCLGRVRVSPYNDEEDAYTPRVLRSRRESSHQQIKGAVDICPIARDGVDHRTRYGGDRLGLGGRRSQRPGKPSSGPQGQADQSREGRCDPQMVARFSPFSGTEVIDAANSFSAAH